jgi:hypothetical protein
MSHAGGCGSGGFSRPTYFTEAEAKVLWVVDLVRDDDEDVKPAVKKEGGGGSSSSGGRRYSGGRRRGGGGGIGY